MTLNAGYKDYDYFDYICIMFFLDFNSKTAERKEDCEVRKEDGDMREIFPGIQRPVEVAYRFTSRNLQPWATFATFFPRLYLPFTVLRHAPFANSIRTWCTRSVHTITTRLYRYCEFRAYTLCTMLRIISYRYRNRLTA